MRCMVQMRSLIYLKVIFSVFVSKTNKTCLMKHLNVILFSEYALLLVICSLKIKENSHLVCVFVNFTFSVICLCDFSSSFPDYFCYRQEKSMIEQEKCSNDSVYLHSFRNFWTNNTGAL